ncbi:MAG: tetratricopeptide repeat protein [Nitrospinae bacterium]|nr:tetratricopeptide repeat protein [Nitrospinota bacterium]
MGADVMTEKIVSLPDYFHDGYVLVADDAANMRRTLKNMLHQIGIYNVEAVEDGNAALRKLKDDGESCRFALLDWNMPAMPGIYVTREIRADSVMRDIPILMITAEANKAQIAQAGEVGVSGYIIKPFVTKILQEKILGVIRAREKPPEYTSLLKAGEVIARRGQYETALLVYNHALKRRNTARVMVQMGELHELIGDDENALLMYDGAAKSNPSYLRAYVKAAEMHVKKGNHEEALASLQKAHEISPASPDRLMMTGKILLKKGEDDKAIQQFDQALKIAPEKAENVAEELLTQGRPEIAEGMLRRALEKDPDDVDALNRLGISLRRQEKWREAVAVYEKALLIDSANEALYFNMAKAYAEGGDLNAALKHYERVLQINPEMGQAIKEIEGINALLRTDYAYGSNRGNSN